LVGYCPGPRRFARPFYWVSAIWRGISACQTLRMAEALRNQVLELSIDQRLEFSRFFREVDLLG
jgi:hypothetical protein